MRRPYECNYPECDKTFTTRFSLSRHIHTHASAKQFMEELCENSFEFKSVDFIFKGILPTTSSFPAGLLTF